MAIKSFLFFTTVSNQFSIAAVFAVFARTGHFVTIKAIFDFENHGLDPGSVTPVLENGKLKLEAAVEFGPVFPGIGKNKIPRFANLEAFLAEYPLVDFHLPFVALLVLVIQRNFAGRACGFVVNNKQFPAFVYPNVVDNSGDLEIGWPVKNGGADIFVVVVAPIGQIRMVERDSIDIVFFHQFVGLAAFAKEVKLFFEEGVDGGV
jgi:hypothetical protein